MKTTLNKIRDKRPCVSGWTKLMRELNKTQADDEELTIVQILDSNGFIDALWCLRAVERRDREIRHYAVWCARQVQHLMPDTRSIAALDVSERFANGLATKEELGAARNACYAACDAVDASYYAEYYVGKAKSSASSAAGSAADTDDVSAYAAACYAVDAAAYDAMDAAAYAAVDATAYDAVKYSARSAQETKLRELCAWCEQNPVKMSEGKV